MELILEEFRLPKNYLRMLSEETTRCSRETLFDANGNVCGACTSYKTQSLSWMIFWINSLTLEAYAVKFFSWWLGTGSLAISYDTSSNTVCALILGLSRPSIREDFMNRLKSKRNLVFHPMLLPLIFCEMIAERHNEQVDASTKRVFTLETSIGVNDYTKRRGQRRLQNQGKAQTEEQKFTEITKSLSGEHSMLANYEKWVGSHVSLLKNIMEEIERYPGEPGRDQPRKSQHMIILRELAAFLSGWNVDLQSRITCQQKIVSGLIQTVRKKLIFSYSAKFMN